MQPFCLAQFPNEIIDDTDPDNPIYGNVSPAVTGQSVATTPGRRYRLALSALVEGYLFGNGTFDIRWNGQSVLGGWSGENPFSTTVTATGARSDLTISLHLDGGCSIALCEDFGIVASIGDPSLQAITTTATPEPATLALVGAGIVGLGWAHRRRTRVA